MLHAALALVCACSLVVGQEGSAPVRRQYPGAEWHQISPRQAGLNAEALRQAAEFIGGRGCVVRYGHLAYSWGDISRREDVASAAKPLYAHFILEAAELGLIPSLDSRVSEFEPGLNSLNPELGYKDRSITWRHMAHQTACYGVSEQPGDAFNYNDYHMALLVDTLFQRVYGATWESVDDALLVPMLTGALQCQDSPTLLAFGLDDRPGRLAISPRDFARFGLLYLREGRWRGEQVISQEHALMVRSDPVPAEVPRSAGIAAQMIPGQRSLGSLAIPDNQCDHLGSYSWLWWLNGVDRDGRRHWPDAPHDAFGAFGHGGVRALVVIPGLDMVVSWNDATIDSTERENRALALLASAVVDQPPVADAHEDWMWLERPDGGDLYLCGPGDPEDFLYRGDELPDGTRAGDQMELIRKLSGSGANSVYLMAIRSHGGDGDASHNPFLNHDPAMPLNTAVLDQWEMWFKAMDEAGIVIYLFLYDDSSRVWDSGDDVGDQERAFIQGMVDRFGHHRHLVWCVAEEAEEALTPPRIRRIAAEIKATDRGRHPVAVHLNEGIDFERYADDPSIDQFAVQLNVATPEELHRGMVDAWRSARGRYGLVMAECSGHGTGDHARHMSWACATAGAHVMVLGMDIAGTDTRDLEDCGRVVSLMEEAGFADMAPHDELALGGTEWVLAVPGQRCIAYTRHSGTALGVQGLSGARCDLLWVSPSTGRTLRQRNVLAQGEPPLWPVPAGFEGEVAAYAVAVGY